MKIILLLLFNISDACFTAYWIRQGIAEELNPVMAYFLQSGEVFFFAVKLGITLIACSVFWLSQELQVSKLGLNLSFILYLLVNLYHLTILFNLL